MTSNCVRCSTLTLPSARALSTLVTGPAWAAVSGQLKLALLARLDRADFELQLAASRMLEARRNDLGQYHAGAPRRYLD